MRSVVGPRVVGTVASTPIRSAFWAAARAMANFGLKDLRLVKPRDGWPNERATAAASRGDTIIAVLNVDSIDGKSDEDMAAGRLTHVVCYSTDEGRALAEFIVSRAARYAIPLDARIHFKPKVNDDHGMFIKAGFRRTVMNVGSFP